jgi:hypothetical protein
METIKPALSKERNSPCLLQFTSSTIQKTNAAGMENMNVKIRVNPNADGEPLNSSDKKNSTLPISTVFSNAAKTQMVKLIKIDLISIMQKHFVFQSISTKKII